MTMPEDSEAVKNPGSDQARRPPGQRAPEGQARQVSPDPNAQREEAGSDAFVHTPVVGSV